MSQRRTLNNSQSQSFNVSTNRAAINECVRYILCREGSKVPIKRVDIANHLATACEAPKNEMSGIIAGAENVLKNVYGYCLAKDDSKGPTQYMVVLNEPCEDTILTPLGEAKDQIILNAALAHIFMCGGSVKEEDLWKFLNKAGLMEDNDSSVRKLFMKTFTSQLYITCTKRDGDNLLRTSFQWGPRANKEVSKMFMLQKVAEALEKQPEFWCEQYKDANGETNNNIRTAPA